MNINQIKLFTWLVSASVTAGIGYYVYEFRIRSGGWVQERRISEPEAAEILMSAVIPVGPKASLVDRDSIERAFYFDPRNRALPNLLDWTGRPPKVVIEEVPDLVESEPEPTFASIAPLIQVVVIFEDLGSSDRGIASVQFTPESKVEPKPEGFPYEIRVGDKLPKPLGFVTVKAILENEIVFSFDDVEREDESVFSIEFDPMAEIYVVSGAKPEVFRPKEDVAQVDENSWRPEHTTMIDTDQWRIGTEDARDFAEDFGGIIAREVRHGRHYNSKLGKYDGIELKEVKPGGKIAGHGGQTGDIIKSINGHPVTSSSEAISFVKNNKDKFSKWIVIVENKGQERTMTFESQSE
ncbi:MAG: hypothetical protein ACI8X5_000320 [Planctomycetota bacterium]|jgi:hypothetical protein